MKPVSGWLLLYVCVLVSVCGIVAAEDGALSIERRPMRLSSGIEQGMLVHGRDEEYVTEFGEGQWISRLSAWLSQEVVIQHRLTIKMGIGGMFWYSFPEMENQAHTLNTKFGPGVAQATGIYTFGDLLDPFIEFQFGYFPFKYNAQAQNLGEYLLRSGVYPGFIVGGSWNIIGDALYRVMGLRFSNYLFEQALKQHVLVSMERDFPPMYDLSFTYIFDYSLERVFTIGGGLCFNHYLPVKPSKTTPEKVFNRYWNGRALNQYEGVNEGGFGVDTLPDEQYYTFKGVKLMARACFDPKGLFQSPIFGEEDLKIFGEVAVLGVKDYPFYYEDISKRIPVMVGINLPVFRILDLFSIQMEWYGCEFENSLENLFLYQVPTWLVSNYDPAAHDDTTNTPDWMPEEYSSYREYFQDDNWKWSINLKKTFGRNFSILAQFANDHTRHKNYDARPQYIPMTRGNSGPFQFFKDDWYFVLRLNFGVDDFIPDE